MRRASGLATLIAAAEWPDKATFSGRWDLDHPVADSPPFIRNSAVGSRRSGAESSLLRASATPLPTADRWTRATPRASYETAFAGDRTTTPELGEAISAIALATPKDSLG